MKLHLGCGQKYLEGYLNIDFPSSEHTVQQTSVADEFHNIYELRYAAGTVAEVRLHHVFEHFERVTACAFLCAWNHWLKAGGIVRIEVPDFERTFEENFSLFNRNRYEGVALRHIFGSQEASWAVHFEGYSKKRLSKLLRCFGFEVLECRQEQYKRTFNLDVTARKITDLSIEDCIKQARLYLRDYLVDESESELRMLETWLGNFKAQLDKSRG